MKVVTSTSDRLLRAQLQKFLDWQDAHVGFDAVVRGIPPRLRGKVPKGFVHSAWDIVEHIRLAQHDILDFCINPKYQKKRWPEDYWPTSRAPRNASVWNDSLKAIRKDRKGMQRLAGDRRVDLFARIPHGSGQTYLREILLVADHTAHHVAQLVDLRRALGIWR